MAEPLQTAASQRTPLTRERVLREGIALADEGGIAALTMRRLAQRLGVEAMSLYHYISGKDELLEGMADLVIAEMTRARPGGDWKAELRRSAISAKDVLSAHPWASQAQATSAHPIPSRFRFMEGLLSTLSAAGFAPAAADHAYHALDSHITGFTLWIASMRLDEVDLSTVARNVLEDLPRAEFPALIEHIEQHLAPPDPDDPGTFAFGLDLILDGLERLLDTPATAAAHRSGNGKKSKKRRG